MKRRGLTVLVGALITAVLSLGIMTAPIPYVILKPGPTVDTLGKDNGREVIQISGTTTSTSGGQLRLTTVGVQPEVKLVTAIMGWFDREEAVVPRELIYPPDQTEKEIDERNAEEFKASQTSAETAALRALGYAVQVKVEKVVPGGPSDGKLLAGDVITTVEDQLVTSAGRLTDVVRAKPAGSNISIAYTRAGKARTVEIITKVDEEGGPPRIGVEIGQVQPHPFTLSIDLDEIGGPSAGLMFSLGIIDKVKPEDLTGGKVIAGTGTIDDEGRVGAIGGIPQKLVGAKAAGAAFFLTPADNCAEAVKNALPGLPLVKVATLDQALEALNSLRTGGQPVMCDGS